MLRLGAEAERVDLSSTTRKLNRKVTNVTPETAAITFGQPVPLGLNVPLRTPLFKATCSYILGLLGHILHSSYSPI